jgi:hypothetical protein
MRDDRLGQLATVACSCMQGFCHPLVTLSVSPHCFLEKNALLPLRQLHICKCFSLPCLLLLLCWFAVPLCMQMVRAGKWPAFWTFGSFCYGHCRPSLSPSSLSLSKFYNQCVHEGCSCGRAWRAARARHAWLSRSNGVTQT